MYLSPFPFSLQMHGRLLGLDVPKVMGIINVTPDSFYSASRTTLQSIVDKVGQMLDEGASIIDIGGCSTRPGSKPVEDNTERDRVMPALEVLSKAFPEALFSIDTFRSSIAAEAVEQYGVAMINDVSGGADPGMFGTVARLQVPYILTDNPSSGSPSDYVSVIRRLAESLLKLRQLGVNDVVADPGLGFGKSLEANYALLHHLHEMEVALQVPLIVGVSRKSMINKVLDTRPEEALNGTIALHALALSEGVRLLRVHDVRPAMECIKICQTYIDNQ